MFVCIIHKLIKSINNRFGAWGNQIHHITCKSANISCDANVNSRDFNDGVISFEDHLLLHHLNTISMLSEVVDCCTLIVQLGPSN